jgi:motility quorum-sensing regulator/GCU-specific mRNA interferase toxin
MEKRKPTYDLEGFRTELCSAAALRMTRTAMRRCFDLGLTLDDEVAVVQSMKRGHFYKSMTAYEETTRWQDVYHVPWDDLALYVKLTVDELGRLILSMKER